MIITANSDFVPHPEADCIGVCVDITPPKTLDSSFGAKEKFKAVFETEVIRDDGRPFLVWSPPFTQSLHEKSGFRGFIRSWFGQDLTEKELNGGFDTEALIGRTARLSIIHVNHNGNTYANIGLIRPQSPDDPPLPSTGNYIRVKDRERDQNLGKSGDDTLTAESDDDTAPDAEVPRW